MKAMERVFIIAMILFSGVVILEGTKLPVKSEYTIGPGFLPIVVGIGIFIVSVISIIQNLLKNKGTDSSKKFFSKEGATRLGIFIGVMIVSLLLSKVFGLLISLAIFMIVIFRYVEKYSWIASIRVAIICNVVFYLVFKIWLGVPLPGISLQ